MLSMGPVFDLAALKMAFASLVRHAEPNSLPSFMLWVDLRVSEFKVTGTLPPALSMDNAMSMIVDDVQKKYCSLDRGDTAETCGTQTSPTSQASNGYVKNGMTDPRYFFPTFDTTSIHCSVQTAPTDLSVRSSQHRRESHKSSDASAKNTLKNVIDNIVKKETLSEVHSNQWSSHMSLPVMMPPAANNITEQHTNLAKLLSNPLMPTESPPASNPNDVSPNRPTKHAMSQLEEFPHKKFRPDISVPSQQALSEVTPLAKDELHSIKSEPVTPEKNELRGKQNGSDVEQGLPSPVNVSPMSKKASALRELLTSKHSSQQNGNQFVANQYTEKLVIDEEGTPEFAEFDHDTTLGSVNEDDIHDKSRQLNTCHVCGQSFHYRSSFRRHMKVHQGIFSHVCAVCGRKFTRKEHFIRHKCSRKPNKASRGAHVDSPPAAGVTPKVEFPPTQSPNQHHQDLSNDLHYQDLPTAPIAGPQKIVHMYESRRKATVPRKVVMVEEYDPDASFEDDSCDVYSAPECAKDKLRAADNRECPSPAKSGCQTNSPSQCERKISLSPKRESKMEDRITTGKKSERLTNGKSATRDKHPDSWSVDGCSGVLDLSCPQVSSSCSPPQLLDHPDVAPSGPQVNYNMVMPTQQEFTIETGSYKVMTGAGGELEEGMRNKFIKVVKQGNYLKLKEEAQIIGGQLCFVCPTCSKIFHRSSNFSRHMRIHRGVYSYVCPNCQRGFFRREHFQKHKCSRRGMSHTWDRKTKIDMVLAANESLLEGSDAEGGSERADSEESYVLSTERMDND